MRKLLNVSERGTHAPHRPTHTSGRAKPIGDRKRGEFTTNLAIMGAYVSVGREEQELKCNLRSSNILLIPWRDFLWISASHKLDSIESSGHKLFILCLFLALLCDAPCLITLKGCARGSAMQPSSDCTNLWDPQGEAASLVVGANTCKLIPFLNTSGKNPPPGGPS